MKAFCWASGVIGFDADDRQPEGTLLIASGPEAKLREKIGVAARDIDINAAVNGRRRPGVAGLLAGN